MKDRRLDILMTLLCLVVSAVAVWSALYLYDAY